MKDEGLANIFPFTGLRLWQCTGYTAVRWPLRNGMYTVRQLLEAKGGQVWSIAPEATVYEALQLMAEKNVGAVLVIQGGNLVGIFSERDYARKVILQARSSKTSRVGEVMTRDV